MIGQTAKPDDFSQAYIEGSNDGSNWVKLSDLPTNLLPQWTSIYLDKSQDNAPFSHIRLAAKASSSIAEIRYYGNVVYQTSDTTESCPVRIKDDFNDITIDNLVVLYDVDKTYTVKSITPEFGPSSGGTSVAFALDDKNTLDGTETVSIKIFGQTITSTITIDTNTLSTINLSSFPFFSKISSALDLWFLNVLILASR